jgi:hypothetical protein
LDRLASSYTFKTRHIQDKTHPRQDTSKTRHIQDKAQPSQTGPYSPVGRIEQPLSKCEHIVCLLQDCAHSNEISFAIIFHLKDEVLIHVLESSNSQYQDVTWLKNDHNYSYFIEIFAFAGVKKNEHGHHACLGFI